MATAKLVIKGEDQLRGPLKQAQNELTGFESVAKKVGDTLKTAFTVAAIVKGLQELSKAVADCVNEFKQSVEVETRLNAVIKATGQQYKYTTRDIKEYASALQEQTRFGDEVIEQSAQLLVATQKFSKEGLERTLELSADLAEAMGTDLTSATSTLSKALIEPGEGLNRLKTIGVSFTDAEEEMIKSLNEAGRELEAQTVILDKVEKAYGGVAKSVGSIDTSTLDKIKEVWGDLKEDLGSVFTTILGPVFDWIYKTLSRLERFANRIKNDVDFNKAMVGGDYTTLANSFDTNFLTGKLNEVSKDYEYAIKELSGEYFNEMSLINEKYGLTIEGFIDKSFEEQQKMLIDLFGDNSRILGILETADFGYQFSIITKALELQRQQEEEWNKQLILEQEKQTDAQNAALIKAAGGLTGVFNSATNNAILGMISSDLGKFLTQSWFGTGISDSTYMSTMYGDIGMWFQTTQSFMETFYEWESDFDEWVRKYGEPDRSSGGGFNFGVASPDFNLPKIVNDFTDTMSLLGPENVRKYLDFGDQKLQDALKAYGSYSESYQADLLQQNINAIQDILDNLIEPGTALYQYFEEIIRGLKSRQVEPSSGSSSGGAVQGLYSWGEKFKSDMEELDSQIQNTLFEDFKSQLGEAGDLIDRLGKNMAQFGPIIGAIVTALHYVIEGFVQEIGPILREFVQWGLEPLRELGRMIGQILLPIFEEIMPSVIATGKVLMQLFQSIAGVLTPIVQVLMRVIGPVLTVLADILVTIVGTISWAIDWLAYCITWVLNKVSFGWIDQTAKPGSLSSYLEGMYSDPTTGYESIDSTTGVNAAYSGVTNIYMNVVNNGYVVGDAGLQEFALVIRSELEDLSYYSR